MNFGANRYSMFYKSILLDFSHYVFFQSIILCQDYWSYLSDIKDPAGYAEYQHPRQEPSSNEEETSGCEDSIPQPSEPIRGLKYLRDEYEGYHSDYHIAR